MTFKLQQNTFKCMLFYFSTLHFSNHERVFTKRPTDSSLLATKNGITDLLQGLFVPSSRFGAETMW